MGKEKWPKYRYPLAYGQYKMSYLVDQKTERGKSGGSGTRSSKQEGWDEPNGVSKVWKSWYCLLVSNVLSDWSEDWKKKNQKTKNKKFWARGMRWSYWNEHKMWKSLYGLSASTESNLQKKKEVLSNQVDRVMGYWHQLASVITYIPFFIKWIHQRPIHQCQG